jgi:hypothetical protein
LLSIGQIRLFLLENKMNEIFIKKPEDGLKDMTKHAIQSNELPSMREPTKKDIKELVESKKKLRDESTEKKAGRPSKEDIEKKKVVDAIS